MNTYYLEKMMEMKQREMEQLSKESSRSHITKKNSVLLLTSLFSRKKAKQSNQVCCA